MKNLLDELRHRTLWQVVIVYIGASWVLLQAIDLFADNLDLPGWLFPTAGAMLLVGLPIVLATAFIQRRLAATGEIADEAHEKLFTWRNALLGGAGAFLLLFGFAGLYVVIQDRGEAFRPADALADEADPGVAVLPFSVRGLPEDTWREGIVEMLAMNLEGVSGIRPISPMTVFARWEEQSGDASQVDAATANAIARASEARFAVVDGSIVLAGDQVRLAGKVVDLESGEALGPLRVEGSEPDVLALLDEFSVALIRLIGTTAVDAEESGLIDLEDVTTSSPTALRHYLRGAHQCRVGDIDNCRLQLDSAVAEDSTFALALYALARAIDGENEVDGRLIESVPLYLAAREHSPSHRLALAIRGALAEQWSYGFWVPGVGEEEFHRTLDELELAVRRDPSDAELWYWLGEIYWHGAEVPGLVMDGVEKAKNAFKQAYILVPGNAYYSSHPIRYAYRNGDWTAVRELTSRALAFDEAVLRGRDWLLDRVVASSLTESEVQELLNDERAPDSAAIGFNVSFWVGRRPSQWPIARAAWERSRPATDVRDCNTRQVSLNAGQLAWYRTEAAESDDVTRLDCLFLLQHYGLSGETPELDSLSQLMPEHWAAVFHAANSGEMGPLEARNVVHRDSALRATTAGDSMGVIYHAGQAVLGETYLAWRQGRPQEAAELADRLPVYLRRLGQLSRMGDRALNRFSHDLTARVYRDAGRLQDAANVLEVTFNKTGFTPALYDLGQVYAEMGKTGPARTAYTEFIERWKNADPRLQPMVDTARAALARLGPMDQ